MVTQIGNLVGGARVKSSSRRHADVFNPATGEIIAKVGLSGAAELAAAVSNSKAAQPAWAATNPQRRARVLMNFVQLLNRDMEKLAEALSREHGKTLPDARGDVVRGLEVAEFCIGAPHLLKGEFSEGAGPEIDIYSMRQPLGVVAGITPFNFPAMIPMWKFCPAIAAGNAFILKPSERAPSVPMMLAELLLEAGLPEGILNVVNGDKQVVDAILDHEDIMALGFVGSTPVAEYIYARGCANAKRVQCFGSAKNHMVIMPDADMDQAADALIGAGYGAAGQRCMAISVAVAVGGQTARKLIEKLAPRVEALKIGPYTDGGDVDFGPLITKQARQRVLALVDSGVEQGASLVVDGRNFSLQGYEEGNFIGGCLFDNVTKDMDIYKEEIFGPVLSVMRAKDYEDAIRLPMQNKYGNGVSIFTRDGDTARDFASRINIGMVGINVPIPVPLAYYTFGGWKKSGFGDLNQHGADSLLYKDQDRHLALAVRHQGRRRVCYPDHELEGVPIDRKFSRPIWISHFQKNKPPFLIWRKVSPRIIWPRMLWSGTSQKPFRSTPFATLPLWAWPASMSKRNMAAPSLPALTPRWCLKRCRTAARALPPLSPFTICAPG